MNPETTKHALESAWHARCRCRSHSGCAQSSEYRSRGAHRVAGGAAIAVSTVARVTARVTARGTALLFSCLRLSLLES